MGGLVCEQRPMSCLPDEPRSSNVNESADTQQLPTRRVFIAFWQTDDTFRLRQLAPFVLYLGGLALYAFVVRVTDVTAQFILPALAGAIGWLTLFPIVYLQIYWRKYDRFIRCPECRDWVGRDASGAWSGDDPKWVAVSQTGRCTMCGARMITPDDEPSN